MSLPKRLLIPAAIFSLTLTMASSLAVSLVQLTDPVNATSSPAWPSQLAPLSTTLIYSGYANHSLKFAPTATINDPLRKLIAQTNPRQANKVHINNAIIGAPVTDPPVPIEPIAPMPVATPINPPMPIIPVIPPHPDQPQPTPVQLRPTPAPVMPIEKPLSPTPTPANSQQPSQSRPATAELSNSELNDLGDLDTAAPTLPQQSNLRGLWIDAFGAGLKTPAQVRQMVNDAEKMGINVLFVQAIRRGDCLCLKSGLPVVSDKDYAPNFDALALAIQLAHQRGIKVIAWTTSMGIANVNAPNNSPQHVMQQHGPKAGAKSWMNRRPDGSWRENNDGWLDPAIPAAADYMVQSVVNLVKNYDIDGIQLDRIRYPDGGNWGYDPKTLARFASETGVQGKPKANNPTWQQWKREQVTSLVRRIALEVKSLRPDVWLSAATITYGQAPEAGDLRAFQKTPTYAKVMQDWPTWIREGLIELNVPMNYKRDQVGQQGKWFDSWNTFAGSVRLRTDGKVAPLAIGTAMYLNSPAITADQAKRSIEQGVGWIGYSYRTPTVAVYGKKQTTKQGLAAVQTAMRKQPNGGGQAILGRGNSWNEKPPTVRGLMGRVVGIKQAGGHVVQALQNSQVVATSLTDSNGYYGFLTLSPGTTEIRVSGQRWTDTIPQKGVVRFPDFLARDFRVLPSTP